MITTRRTIALTTLLVLSIVTAAMSQLALNPFRYDVTTFFAGSNGKTWVGQARMFNAHYTDTVHVGYNADLDAISIRRVLIDDDEHKAVSYGVGLIKHGPTDSLFSITWTEKNYEEATGQMVWNAEYGQWSVNFDGPWKQWFINIRHVSDDAFEAGVARQVAAFPPVELLDATYHLVTD